MEKDLYAVLGITPNANTQIIKKAYRQLVHEFHPDRYQNHSEEERAHANERMLEITEAFRILGDPEEKAAYDKKLADEYKARATARTAAASAVARPPAAQPTAAQSKLGRAMAQDFVGKLFAQLTGAQAGGVQWEEEASDSRDWTRCLRFSQFGVGYYLQLYQTRDATPSLAQQFVRNAEAFVNSQKSVLRNSFFIFVLAFEKITAGEEVMAICNRFVRMGKSGPLTAWRAVIVLLDAHNMRSVFSGRPIPVEPLNRTFQILQGKW